MSIFILYIRNMKKERGETQLYRCRLNETNDDKRFKDVMKNWH